MHSIGPMSFSFLRLAEAPVIRSVAFLPHFSWCQCFVCSAMLNVQFIRAYFAFIGPKHAPALIKSTKMRKVPFNEHFLAHTPFFHRCCMIERLRKWWSGLWNYQNEEFRIRCNAWNYPNWKLKLKKLTEGVPKVVPVYLDWSFPRINSENLCIIKFILLWNSVHIFPLARLCSWFSLLLPLWIWCCSWNCCDGNDFMKIIPTKHNETDRWKISRRESKWVEKRPSQKFFSRIRNFIFSPSYLPLNFFVPVFRCSGKRFWDTDTHTTTDSNKAAFHLGWFFPSHSEKSCIIYEITSRCKWTVFFSGRGFNFDDERRKVTQKWRSSD